MTPEQFELLINAINSMERVIFGGALCISLMLLGILISGMKG